MSSIFDKIKLAFTSAEETHKKRFKGTVKDRAEKKAKKKRENVSGLENVLDKLKSLRTSLMDSGVLSGKRERVILEEEIGQPDEYERLIDSEAWNNIRKGARILKKLFSALSDLNSFENELSKIKSRDVEILEELGRLERDKIEILEKIEEFKGENLEYRDLFYLYDLRRLQDEGLKEIVSTSSTEDYRARIRKVMDLGGRTILGGPTGAGKTVMAEMVAREIRQENIQKAKEADDKEELQRLQNIPAFRKVVGSKHTETQEVVGHDVVRVKEFDIGNVERIQNYLTTIDKQVMGYKTKVQSERGYLITPEEIAKYQDLLVRSIPFAGTGMETQFQMGPIYKCMEEGIPFILDEVNGLPPDVLLKLNYLMTVNEGDEVEIQENGRQIVIVKKGFSIICTGNFGELYKGRSALDLSFINRIDTRIDVDYVPNETHVQAVLGEEDVMKSELFLIMLSKWMSNSKDFLRGGGKAEKDTLEVMWNFAKFVRRIQDISLGKEKGLTIDVREGQGSKVLNVSDFIKNPISMREVLNILKSYFDGMGRGVPFEQYVLEQIFMVPDTDSSHNAEYMGNGKKFIYYDLLKQYGFFTRLGGAFSGFENSCLQKGLSKDGVKFEVDKKKVERFWRSKSVEEKLFEIQGKVEFLGGRQLVHDLVGDFGKERDYGNLIQKLSGDEMNKLKEERATEENAAREELRSSIVSQAEQLLGKINKVLEPEHANRNQNN